MWRGNSAYNKGTNMKYLLITLLLVLVGCGKQTHTVEIEASEEFPTVEIEGPEDIVIEAPEDIVVGPDFEGAAAFCDNRYLPDNETEAEACFQDYRNYFDVEIGLDLDAIASFCENTYNHLDSPAKEVAIAACQDDLIKALEFSTNPQTNTGR